MIQDDGPRVAWTLSKHQLLLHQKGNVFVPATICRRHAPNIWNGKLLSNQSTDGKKYSS